uniref:Uncharacterized protein n=1 Tax=viral metagenome TaxID=1070528 RepID=A0A6C0HSY9_9ZZZZ
MEKSKSKVFRSSRKPTKKSKSVMRKREINKFNRTQKRSNKPTASKKYKPKKRISIETEEASSNISSLSSGSLDSNSPFIDMEIDPDLEPKELKLDLSFKGISVSFVIFGHGGIKNKIPIETFKLPHATKETNLLAMRYSGINNIGNRSYEENIDKFLSENKNKKTDTLIQELDTSFLRFLPHHSEVLQRVHEIDDRLNIQNKFFGVKQNYNSRNAQKYYTGITSKELLRSYRHPEIKMTGPLVKIYSIVINNVEQLAQGQSIIVDRNIVNGITLTEIINIVTQFVLDSGIIPTLARSDIAKEKGFLVNVVDLTCNYTEEYPLIEVIGPSRK